MDLGRRITAEPSVGSRVTTPHIRVETRRMAVAPATSAAVLRTVARTTSPSTARPRLVESSTAVALATSAVPRTAAPTTSVAALSIVATSGVDLRAQAPTAVELRTAAVRVTSAVELPAEATSVAVRRTAAAARLTSVEPRMVAVVARHMPHPRRILLRVVVAASPKDTVNS